MKAAVITAFDQPPRYGDFADPEARAPTDMPIDVLAAGLHHVTRGRAAGLHYSSTAELPQVPGIDGVGRGPDGKLRYFVQEPGRTGTMAERTVIERSHSIELPDGCDPVAIAAAMNPAMASWIALRCRAPGFRWRLPFQRGRRVLILGATGSSGRLAVQIARHLGASQVFAVGRNAARLAELPALGATGTILLGDERLGAAACETDVVLDFIWGESAVRCMESMLAQRESHSLPLTWIHLGSMAGEIAPIPGTLLRRADLRILGSGHGAVSGHAILRELPRLAREIARGTFRVDARAVPLNQVERTWSRPDPGNTRIVFTP